MTGLPRPLRHAAAGAAYALRLSCGAPEPSAAASEPDRVLPANRAADPVRLKGTEPRLVIHRKLGDRIGQLRPGALAHPGDLVQVSVVAAGNRHGMVLSVDDRGVVTLHHPARPNGSTRLVARGPFPLPHAFELDALSRFERFFLVTTGNTPTDTTVVLRAAQRLADRGFTAAYGDLPLPPSFSQTSVMLSKVP